MQAHQWRATLQPADKQVTASKRRIHEFTYYRRLNPASKMPVPILKPLTCGFVLPHPRLPISPSIPSHSHLHKRRVHRTFFGSYARTSPSASTPWPIAGIISPSRIRFAVALNVLRLPNLRLDAEGAQATSVTGRGLGRRAASAARSRKRFSYALVSPIVAHREPLT